MLFRRPKLIKWTLRKLDEIGMGTSPENGTVPCRPAFIRACWRIEYGGPLLLQKNSSISSISFVNRLVLLSAD
jgi:hypothetical protein